jgi:hypothetical protein
MRSIVGAIALLLFAAVSTTADDAAIAEFSASWSQTQWLVTYLPSGTPAGTGAVAVHIEDGALQMVLAADRMPEDTHGVAILIAGTFPPTVENVGVWNTLSAEIWSDRDHLGLAVVLRDQDGQETVMRLGQLAPGAWRHYALANAGYVDSVRDREGTRLPDYPAYAPELRLAGFVLSGDLFPDGGDQSAETKTAHVRIRSVRLQFDRAFLRR